jgi:hypothetical protein
VILDNIRQISKSNLLLEKREITSAYKTMVDFYQIDVCDEYLLVSRTGNGRLTFFSPNIQIQTNVSFSYSFWFIKEK